MIARVPVERVIELVGNKKTYPRDLRAALEFYGWEMGERGCCKLPMFPSLAAAMFCQTVSNHRLYGHWMLFTGSEVLDPSGIAKGCDVHPDWTGTFYSIRRK